MNEVTIDKEWIQNDAETYFETKLTDDEIEDVFEDVCGELQWVIQEAIGRVTCIEERNEEAKKVFPHYQVMRRDGFTDENEFKPVQYGCFLTERDAKRFARRIDSLFDQLKVELVTQDGAVVRS